MSFLNINGKSVYYTRQSSEHSTYSILMIHGLGSSSSFYAPIIPALVDAGLDCVAFDTYGSGLSKFTNGDDQSVHTIAEDVESIIFQLSLNRAKTVLVGHSMGGMVACELASRNEYAGIVLLGPVNPQPGLAGIFNARVERIRKSGMECLADEIPRAATGSKSTPLHWAFIRALILAQEVEGYASLCRVIAEAQAPNYGAIKCPVLCLAGSDDKTCPLKNVSEMYNACGSAENVKNLEVLDGVGHWHVIEASDLVASHTIEFFKSTISN